MKKTRPTFWCITSLLAAVFLASCEGPAAAFSSSGTDSALTKRERRFAEGPQERPGLGTRWGENRNSSINVVSFRRANSSRPLAQAAIYYNDRAGINAMVGAMPLARRQPALPLPAAELLSVELRDGSDRLLPGIAFGDRWFVIGKEGERYVIVVHNRSDFRIEVVLSVDGLDVLDGRAASFRKRGYILPRGGTIRVEGFRKSGTAVAAFRFSSVRESYANRKHGETRNVGVIGIGAFHEEGTDPLSEEARRRLRADPFPGRFATPP